ncbi:50S ribosomal protein L4 [Candidatus Uhrbacteria bacterium]|nr:50S ribosomal protein L4 [Candidatus Uhrbacteria bacterium]
MPKVPLYNQAGERVGDTELADHLFHVEPNPALVHQVVVALQANSRTTIAHTKTRGEVRGGGKKPWKQKHTGRARHGSIRSPIWVGGGVVFGPRKDRNYEKKIPKQMKRQALAVALSDRVRHDALKALDTVQLPEMKTKHVASMITILQEKIPLHAKKMLLIVQKQPDVIRASRNIPTVTAVGADAVSILDIIGHPAVIATRAALDRLSALHKK